MNQEEPMFDDIELEMIKQQGIKDLIRALYDNTNDLIENIASLRKEINSIHRELYMERHKDMSGYMDRYLNLYEDINRSFIDFPAYEEFLGDIAHNE